jgi:hypothetical protein
MGKPFVKKYQFSFDPDKKMIFFFNNIQMKDNDFYNNQSSFIIIIIIVIGTFIFICLIFFLSVKLYLIKRMNRTKKAYELEDEYEYISKNDKTYIINDN